MHTDIAIFGAGGFAREVAWLAENGADADGRIARPKCFISDREAEWGQELNGVPVLSLDNAVSLCPGAPMIVAVGDPTSRKKIVQNLLRRNIRFCTLWHSNVTMSRFVKFGQGSIVCSGSTLTTNISIGNHVHINLDCTIGHDTIIEDYVTLSPGVHVSGRVRIEEGAYIGTGAVIINGSPTQELVIGGYSVVGAGACVVRDIEPHVTAVGVPAKAIKRAP